MSLINLLIIFCFVVGVRTQTGLQTCSCVPRNQCYQNISSVTDGSGLIDMRIVNTGGLPTVPPTVPPTVIPGQCVPGVTDQCCSGPGVVGCGLRYQIPSPPAPAPAPGQLIYGSQPWQAVLYDLSNNFIGTGVLLDPSNVLTVAHKVVGRQPGTLKVRLGDWDVIRDIEPLKPQERVVAQIRINPNFNQTVPVLMSNLQNDIAILRLAAPITSDNPAINSACLPASSFVFDGMRCLVSGWGKDLYNGSYQAIARQAEIPVVPNADCQARLRTTRLGPFFNLDPVSFMCAGGELGQDACTGDGGGALACTVGGRYQVAGLVSWGIGCGNTIPGVYVRVSSFISWIQAQLAS